MENQIAFAGAIEPEQKLVVTELKILSVKQFLLLSFLSLSLYPVWWSYKVWRFFKEKENSDILPAVRTVFGIFYFLPLFNKILNFAQRNGYREKYYSVVLYLGVIGFSLLSRLPDPYALISILGITFFVPPLMAFNYGLATDPEVEVEIQTSFNTRQIVLMVIGGIIWFFALLGLILMLLGFE